VEGGTGERNRKAQAREKRFQTAEGRAGENERGNIERQSPGRGLGPSRGRGRERGGRGGTATAGVRHSFELISRMLERLSSARCKTCNAS